MPYRHTAQLRIRWVRVAVLVAALAVVAAILGHQLPASSSSASSAAPSTISAAPADVPRRASHERRAALGEADGAIPDGTTVFDDGVPGVARLDPDLLAALRRAATDASSDGVRFVVDSGWRSAVYQQHLLDDAIAQYGSEAEAARWVATPQTSAHVSGDAVDIGPTAAATWLDDHGAAYGLCRIYDNEPWHFELRPQAPANGCPPRYADPTHDPRMSR